MAVRKKAPAKTHQAPAPLMEALDGFASPFGTFRRGVTVAGDAEVVKAYPNLFVRADAPHADKHASWVGLQDRSIQLTQTHRPDSANRTVSAEDTVVAVGSYSAPVGGGLAAVEAGQRLHKSHPLVQAKPDWFAPIVSDE